MGKLRDAAAIIAISLSAALLGACNPVYRIDIKQGNALDAEDIEKLQLGMTEAQVRYVLGNPLVADSFNSTRWDYLYYFKAGKARKVERRHMIVYFEEGTVTRIEWPDGAPPKKEDKEDKKAKDS